MAIGDIIVGLDIGVSKVSCVIGQVNKFSEIEVIGYGLSNNSGIKRGQILDYERVGQSIKDAVNSAEQISELSVNSAYVNIKGMNVRIEKVVMESEVERPNDGMTVNDIYNLSVGAFILGNYRLGIFTCDFIVSNTEVQLAIV